MDVVASMQLAMESLSRLKNLSKKLEDADFKMALADLADKLADAKLEMAELKTACARLTEERDHLRASIDRRDSGKPAFKNGLYVFDDDPGPFCTACFDSKTMRIRVSARTGPLTQFGKWTCPVCHANYKGS